jgi:hypothetical protein
MLSRSHVPDVGSASGPTLRQIRRDGKHRLQENEENGFLPAAYRRSNLYQAANIKMVRERGAKFTASFLQIGANRPFPAGSPFSAGLRRAA